MKNIDYLATISKSLGMAILAAKNQEVQSVIQFADKIRSCEDQLICAIESGLSVGIEIGKYSDILNECREMARTTPIEYTIILQARIDDINDEIRDKSIARLPYSLRRLGGAGLSASDAVAALSKNIKKKFNHKKRRYNRRRSNKKYF